MNPQAVVIKDPLFCIQLSYKYDTSFISFCKKYHGRWEPQTKKWEIFFEEVLKDNNTFNQFISELKNFYEKNDISKIESEMRPYLACKGYGFIQDTVLYVRTVFDMNILRILQEDLFSQWDKKQKMNKISIIPSRLNVIIDFLKTYNVYVQGGIEKVYEAVKILQTNIKESYSHNVDDDIDVQNLKTPLYPFQIKGVQFLIKNQGRGIVADEMGLGKTAQALGYIASTNAKKVLIICPGGLTYNWENEIHKFISDDPSTLVIDRISLPRLLISSDVKQISARFFILSYSFLTKAIPAIQSYKFDTVVVDEAHYIKNIKAQRTKIILPFLRAQNSVIFLTGTPLLNKPIEIFNMLSVLDPKIFNNKIHFGKNFCNARKTKYGWDFSGSSNRDVLAEILRGKYMIRREKREVIADLPNKTRTIIKLNWHNTEIKNLLKEIKDVAKRTKEGSLDRLEGQRILIQYMDMYKRIAYEDKKEQIFEFIDSLLEQKENAVIFCYHVDVLAELVEKYKDHCEYITSNMSTKERFETVKRYNQNDKPLFITTIGVGAEGFNLQKAQNVVFVQFDWVPGKLLQAEDRVHRIGQKNATNVYYFALDKSIDINFLEKILEKSEIQDDILANIYKTFEADTIEI